MKKNDYENQPCLSCGGERMIRIGPTAGGDYLHCLGCGLERQVHRDQDSLMKSFAEAQSEYYGHESAFQNPMMHRLQRQLAARRLLILSRYLTSGRILEVGPGGGELLRAARAKGYQVAAVEEAPVLADRLENEMGITIYRGMFEKIDFAGQTFDAVVSSQVIEHVPQPLEHLQAARTAVRPGGLILVATPNIGSWSRWIAGRRWPDYSPAHLYLFNVKSLNLCLERSGWQVLAVHTLQSTYESLRTCYNMVRMVRKSSGIRPPRQAGTVTRQTPYYLAAAVLQTCALLTWPIRRLLMATNSGVEVVVVARAA